MGAPSAPRMITWGAAGSPQTPRLRALLWGVAVLLHIAPGAGVAKRAQPCAKRPTPFPAKKRMGKTGAKRQAAVLGSAWGWRMRRPGAWRCRDMPLLGLAKPAAEPAAQGAAQARNAKIATIRQNQRQFSLPAPAAQAARGHLRPGKRPCPQVCFPVSQVFSSLWRFVGFAGRPGRWP